jgi:CheY-like chemotaxis protein
MVDHSDETSGADAGDLVANRVVVIVEDEMLLRGTTAEFLRLLGYTVIETSTAAEAVAELESGSSIDLVFSDIGLSGPMDGLALARWVRQRYADVPVMLTSGYGDATRQAATDLVGDALFLSKPYRQEVLADRIHCVLEASLEVRYWATSGSSKR